MMTEIVIDEQQQNRLSIVRSTFARWKDLANNVPFFCVMGSDCGRNNKHFSDETEQ